MSGIESENYAYLRSGGSVGLPCLKLKPGKKGLVSLVDFYQEDDWLRGEAINITMGDERQMTRSVGKEARFPPKLEDCQPTQLEAVASAVGTNEEEVRELYSLVMRLKSEVPDYRVYLQPTD